jgi:signal transduction histidine kinase
MRRVADGDLGERAQLASPLEFAELGDQFNTMLARLEATNKEVETVYAEGMARVDRLATVGEMTTALSHEIRNPLAGLSGALQILHKESASTEHREIIDEMRDTVGRLARTTDELLTYGRAPKASLANHDVNRCVQSVLSFVALQLPTNVEIIPRMTSGLPPVRVDSLQLQQALLNVALNAVQAMPDGGALEVSTTRAPSTYPGRERVVVEVTDSGVGVSDEDKARIFEPFHTTREKGTGLGLGITVGIIEGFGGRLELTSTVGVGTTVKMWLPALAADTSTTADGPEGPGGAS